MCSEEKIIDLIANRDESGMRELMERYQRPLMKLAMNMLDSEEDARECVNDTFYEVWKSVPDNRPQYLFAYSATICRHIICKRIDHDNALKRSSNVIELTAEMEQCIGKPDKALEGDEHMVGELINTFLKTLDTDKRNIFIKRYWCSQPVKVISKELGKSESSVKVALHRLRKDLKKFLESEGVLV